MLCRCREKKLRFKNGRADVPLRVMVAGSCSSNKVGVSTMRNSVMHTSGMTFWLNKGPLRYITYLTLVCIA